LSGIVGLLKATVESGGLTQFTKRSVSVTKLTTAQTVSPRKKVVLGVVQSAAKVSMVSGEDWGIGKGDRRVDDHGAKLELEGRVAFGCEELPAGAGLDRTE